MKKTLVALATLSAIGSAFADIDVSGGIKLYGVLDQAALKQTWQSSGSAVGTSTGQYTTGNNNSNAGLYAAAATSRLGVRGTRNLGDDITGLLQIEIELQPQINSDQALSGKTQNGLLPMKNRGTFVGLERANVGTIKFGTQETTAYELFAMDVNGRVEYKPQVWRYVASNSTQDRAGNALKYTSAEFSGFKADVMYAFPEGTNNGTNAKNTPAFTSYGVKYNKGNLKAAWVVDFSKGSNSADQSAGLYRMPGDQYEGVTTIGEGTKTTYAYQSGLTTLRRNIAGLTYDFGPALVNLIYADSGNANGKLTTTTVGIRVPLDKLTLAASYGTGSYSGFKSAGSAVNGKVGDVTIGAYYNFDKSTSVYLLNSNATHTYLTNTGGYTNSTAVGVQYRF
jgi:predicted porin